jgi:hypothetical protein
MWCSARKGVVRICDIFFDFDMPLSTDAFSARSFKENSSGDVERGVPQSVGVRA